MRSSLLGVETEYAVAAFGPQGESLDVREVLPALLEGVRAQVAALPDAHSNLGWFLGNGARVYVDCDTHPEFATPECADPWEVVGYIKAGDRLLAMAVADCFARQPLANPIREIRVWKSNVDYSGSETAWGCHESYQHHVTNLQEVESSLLPFLASRIIFTGAGGWNPQSPGLEFSLSPRVTYLHRACVEAMTPVRGIFHRKDEPLSGNSHRLHVICGESLFSERGMILKLASTAMVVALVESGIRPACGVDLLDPVSAMRTFAADPTCQVTAQGIDGKPLTALEIQRHYLYQTAPYLTCANMPSWAPKAWALWKSVLDDLDTAPQSVMSSLDWATKFAIFRSHATMRGISWDSFPIWTKILTRLLDAWVVTHNLAPHNFDAEHILVTKSPLEKLVKSYTSRLRRAHLSWDDLPGFLALRQEFFEIDTRFGYISPHGIFAKLEEAQVVHYSMPDIPFPHRLLTNPPRQGRAAVRGHCITRNCSRPDDFSCDWTRIEDRKGRTFLNLEDPFINEELWEHDVVSG